VRQQALALLSRLEDPQTQPLNARLEQMKTRIDGDYLAAGKLSGNSQWLLQNAENELTTQAKACSVTASREQPPGGIRPLPSSIARGRPTS
jgi:hypothetical protein